MVYGYYPTVKHLRSFLIIGALSVLCASCSNNTRDSRGTSDGIVINLDAGFSKEFSIFDVFSKVEIVELENALNAQVAEETIICKAFGDSSFFLLDRGDHLLKRFDYQGKLISTSNYFGRGPGEFTMAQDMIVNKYTNTLDILDPRGIIYKYRLQDLSWEQTIDLSEKMNSAHFFAAASQKEYLFYSLVDSPAVFICSTDEDIAVRPLSNSVPEWLRRSSFCGGGSPFFDTDQGLFYVEKSDGSVYRFDGKSLARESSWDMGKYSFNAEELTPDKDYFYYSRLAETMTRKSAFSFCRTAETRKYLLQNFRFKGRNNWNAIVFDKERNQATIVKQTKEGVYLLAGEIVENKMYYLINPSILGIVVNENVLKDRRDLETLKQIKDESNIILVRYEFIDE